jgi:AraC-like DNA-binding protein
MIDTPDKFVPTATVQDLHLRLRQQHISVARAARELGVSRPHLSQMLNTNLPMTRVYWMALRYLLWTEANRQEARAALQGAGTG